MTLKMSAVIASIRRTLTSCIDGYVGLQTLTVVGDVINSSSSHCSRFSYSNSVVAAASNCSECGGVLNLTVVQYSIPVSDRHAATMSSWGPDKRPLGQKATGQKATVQKATPVNKYKIFALYCVSFSVVSAYYTYGTPHVSP